MEKRLSLKNVQDQSFDNNVSSILDQYVFKMPYFLNICFELCAAFRLSNMMSYDYDI